ncbi:hypothetical protein [Peribacillus loiseleuriae]|uniref:hypothetical protein n=1 Tax=Peribacillus loiseleuriae TaxID=1679170 RepID=UPI003D0315B3
MNEIDIALTIYVIFMIIASFVSFKYGSFMIRKTGLFLPNSLIAGTLNLVIGILVIIGWFFFSWRVNEFLFFGGLVLGISMLFVKRKRMIQFYNENFKTT